MLTTAEGSSNRFEPIFLQNVFFICIPEPQKNLTTFLGFDPLKQLLFCRGSLAGQISRIVVLPDWPDFQNCGAKFTDPVLYFKSQITEKYSTAMC